MTIQIDIIVIYLFIPFDNYHPSSSLSSLSSVLLATIIDPLSLIVIIQYHHDRYHYQHYLSIYISILSHDCSLYTLLSSLVTTFFFTIYYYYYYYIMTTHHQHIYYYYQLTSITIITIITIIKKVAAGIYYYLFYIFFFTQLCRCYLCILYIIV